MNLIFFQLYVTIQWYVLLQQCLNTMVSLTFGKVPEYSPSLDEEGVCKTAFELIFAFDEAISLGNKENVTVQQVKQYCEMESHEEKAHKLMMQAKINETKDVMKKKANELDKMRVCTTLFTRFRIHCDSFKLLIHSEHIFANPVSLKNNLLGWNL